ncbi:hypothetical protein D3C72_1537510 [compost metagenome]
MGLVVLQGQRPGDAGAGEQQALLALEIGNFLHRPQGPRMGAGIALQRVEQGRNVLGRQRAEAQPALVAIQLQQGFQPIEATGTGAPQLQRQVPPLGLAGQRHGHLVGAHGAGHGITGDAQLQHDPSSRQPFTSACRRSGVSRACNWPSSSRAGEQAQAPRQ